MTATPELALAWAALQARVLERDGRRCRNCGSGERLQAHRWLPAPRDGAGPRPDALVTLCEPCRSALARARAGRAAGPTTGDPATNLFELWRLNGEQLPLRVVKATWSRSVVQFYQVEKVEIRTWPYGTAWGRYVREDQVGPLTKVPNAGTYGWRIYRDPRG